MLKAQETACLKGGCWICESNLGAMLLFDFNHDLALRTPCFDEGQGLIGCFKREDAVHNWSNGS